MLMIREEPPDGRTSPRCILCGSDGGLYLLKAPGTMAHGRLVCRCHHDGPDELAVQVMRALQALWVRAALPLDPNEAGEGGE